ncbi:hypothetical protein CVT25_009689 [Psilocybe cyanescens]|uniref:Uncharacterized protein n=1 Tax=Psilocybe cyanescens TaxID=93625 RepID=A0A409XDC2_PSICY|nr:hypothetical protein CVT25_009689 [Psilocybe cyanescens]
MGILCPSEHILSPKPPSEMDEEHTRGQKRKRSSSAHKPTIPPAMPLAKATILDYLSSFGKPTTHSRNQCRRKKREFDKTAALIRKTKPTSALPKGSSGANSLPLGPSKTRSTLPTADPSTAVPVAHPATPTYAPQKNAGAEHDVDTETGGTLPRSTLGTEGVSSSSTPVCIIKEQVMMSSLRNRNKKGFKLSIANPIPQRSSFRPMSPRMAHRMTGLHLVRERQ